MGSGVTITTLMDTMDNLEEMGKLLISTDKKDLLRMAKELENNPNRSEQEDDLLGYIKVQLSCGGGMF